MKDDIVYIKHILASIENVEKFSSNLKKTDFLKDRFSQSAIIRELEKLQKICQKVLEKNILA